MTTMDILTEIRDSQDECFELLRRFKKANISSEDVANAESTKTRALPLHFVLRFCSGAGILELIKYLVELYPEGVARRTIHGHLPIHVLPGRPRGQQVDGESPRVKSSASMQQDQLEARLFLMYYYTEGLNVTDKKGYTPLVRAIRVHYNEIVKVIVEEFQEHVQESCKTMDQRTPLNHAAQGSNFDAVKMLIRACPEYATNPQVPLQFLYSVGNLHTLEDQMKMIGIIAEVLPQIFEISCKCNKGELGCNCKLSDHPVNYFLRLNTQLPAWKQGFVKCLLKHSFSRPRSRSDSVPYPTATVGSPNVSADHKNTVISLELDLKAMKLKKEELEVRLQTAKAELEKAKEGHSDESNK